MDLKEFKTIDQYLEELRNPPTPPKWEKPKETIKNSAFPTVMAAFLTPLKTSGFRVRDYLDRDGTFAMLVESQDCILNFGDQLKVFLDAKDYIEQVTYTKSKNVGIIEFPHEENYYSGFWIHYQ
jgi:hypothetical protein